MIALQSLKYKILEWCLDTFLNKLIFNFNNASNILINPDGTIDVKNLQEGMNISEIRAWVKTDYDEGGNYKIYYTWLNCKITEVIKYDERSDSFIEIQWTYSSLLTDGELVADENKPRYGNWVYDPYDSYDDHIEFFK